MKNNKSNSKSTITVIDKSLNVRIARLNDMMSECLTKDRIKMRATPSTQSMIADTPKTLMKKSTTHRPVRFIKLNTKHNIEEM